MLSKLEAAKIANSAGVHLAIISGHKDHPLSAFAQTGQGTVFHSAGSQGARKKWLAGRLTVKGHISVDAGAAKALAGGNSLLPAGVLTDRKSTSLNSSTNAQLLCRLLLEKKKK